MDSLCGERMINLNLLPWREQQREKKNKLFFLKLIVSVLIGLVLNYCLSQYYAEKRDKQYIRNKYINEEISILNKKSEELRALKESKNTLIERLLVIQELQKRKFVLGKLFEQLISTLPEGVYLKEVLLRDQYLTINGIAISNDLVSVFMRNLDDSNELFYPELDNLVITRIEDLGRVYLFKVAARQQMSPVGFSQ